VISLAGFDERTNAPVATIGLLTPDGNGNAAMVLDSNDSGVFQPLQAATVGYAVSANGRTVVSGLGGPSPVVYLVGANAGFVVGADLLASGGRLQPQTGGPFSNASLQGAYAYGTEGADIGHRLTATGTISFDGTNDHPTEDQSTPAGLFAGVSLGSPLYSFSSIASPPGRGSLDPDGRAVAYIVSPTQLVYINTPATEPRLVFVDK
jgi:hypothetical protein